MKYIKVGIRGLLFAAVDDEDYELVSQYVWVAVRSKGGSRIYAQRRMEDGRRQYMHRMIMGVDDRKLVVDHIDHDCLNNQRSNLRVTRQGVNLQNMLPRGGWSQFKGVSYNKRANRWVSSIRLDGKQRHLGCFDSEVDAAIAYDNAARKLFSSPYLNFPNDGEVGIEWMVSS